MKKKEIGGGIWEAENPDRNWEIEKSKTSQSWVCAEEEETDKSCRSLEREEEKLKKKKKNRQKSWVCARGWEKSMHIDEKKKPGEMKEREEELCGIVWNCVYCVVFCSYCVVFCWHSMKYMTKCYTIAYTMSRKYHKIYE